MFVELISTALQYATIPVTDGQTQSWVCQYFTSDLNVKAGNQYLINVEVPVRNDTQNNVEFATITAVTPTIAREPDFGSALSVSPINGANITPGNHYGVHRRSWFYQATQNDERRGVIYFGVYARARCSIPGGQLTGQLGQGFIRVLKIGAITK